MDDHISEGEAPGKEPLTRTVTEQSNDKSEKSEISSILYKDSGYGSLGHSASSSMGPIIPPTGIFNHYFPSTSERAKTPSTTPSCRSGGSSLVNSQSSSTMTATSKQIDPPGQRIKISASSRKKVKNNLEKEKKKDKETDEQPNFLTSKESKAAKVATLSQALIAVDQFRKSQASKNEKSDKAKEDEIKTLVSNLTEVCQGSKVTHSKREEASQGLYGDPVTDTILESGLNLESDGFCVAVSMSNGMVIHTTPTLSSVLGYPKDMWIGRSIIDFVHPKDREFFISQVTDNINLPVEKSKSANIKNKSRSFYCRFRMYSGLKSGFAVKERKKKFRFFKICVCFSEINNLDTEEIYLFITAIPLSSPYNTSNEDGPIKCKNNIQGVFSTKHTSLCTFSFIDENLVSYLGHFPHELEGMDIFEIIHPQDLSIIKESFENLVFGKNCRSQPYRMKTRNGDFVSLVTTWSCFINPWNQQLEFINGKHTIIKGPKNPQIFMEPVEDQTDVLSEEKVKISSLQEDIKLILQKTVQKNQISKFHGASSTESKKKLSSFMGTLLQEVAKAENFDLSRTAKHGAVVIGNISPHQSDSSESPPSYNQLTYNENLTRFFNSQPKTLSEKDIVSGFVCSPESYEDNPKDIVKQKFKKEQRKSKSGGSGEDGGRSQGGSGQGSGEQQGSGTGVSGSGEDAKNSSSLQIGLSAGHTQPGGEECFMSQDGCTSGSGSRLGSGSRERDEEYKPTAITEELLEVHNREMEKQMISKFKEAKRVGDPGFLKEGKNRVQESASKRVLVSKAKVKIEEAQGASVRKHNSTTPDKMTKSAGRSNACHTESLGQAQEYQRPLAFTDSHFSSYSGTSTPNILPQPSRQGMDGALSYPVPVGSFLQGSLTEEGNQKYIQVPAIMIPISCASSRQSPGFPTNMPLGLMMQGTPTGFIPLCVGDPVRGFSYKMPGQENEPESSMRLKPSNSRQSSAANQFELPNCLAVNSCMTLRENVKGQEVKKSLKKETTLRTASGDGGSRHTSVKGEPGSALESNASPGVSVKERQERSTVEQKQINKQIGDELCSSSQSLYSFLPSSDENDITDFLQASSGKPDDSGEDEKSVRRVARPVLSEPFWNEGITITDKLMKTYQLPQLELEQVLRSDLMKLQKMAQPDMIEEQLAELKMSMDNLDEFETSKLFMENEEEDDDETETTSPDEGEKDEKYKKRIKNLKKLEKLNIFMEENSPFPEKISPSKSVENDPKIFKEPTDEDIQENPSNLEEAFRLTLRRQDGTKKNEEFIHFQSSRPQQNKFKYGTGLEFNKVTEAKKLDEKEEKSKLTNTNLARASDDPRIKDSTDDSSDEGLKTSSSVKSSDPNSDDHDQLKRKKGQLSPSSDSSAKPEDKKLRLVSESDSSTEMKYVREDADKVKN